MGGNQTKSRLTLSLRVTPLKIKDDCIDTLRGFAMQWGPTVKPVTKEEARIAKLPEELKPEEVMAKLGTPVFVETYLAQRQALNQIKIAEERERAEEQKKWARFFGRAVQHRKYRGGA